MKKVKICKSSETERAVAFRCPGCDDMHVVPFEGPGAWEWNGDLAKPTLSPSLLIRSGHYVPGKEGKECWCHYDWGDQAGNPIFTCGVCHSFVREGRIEFLSDCTHHLAGQTVDLAEIPE